MHVSRTLVVAFSLLGLASCSGASGDAADAGVPDDGGPSAFSAVQAIFAASCVRCHDPAQPFVPETQTFTALSLTTSGAYAALVNKAAAETCGGMLVTPGDPAKSFLYAKVTEATPCDGTRMPHQGMIANTPPLPDDQIATIEAWILGGARR